VPSSSGVIVRRSSVRRTALLGVVVLAAGTGAVTSGAFAARPAAAPAASAPRGLPAGAPPAATEPEPTLPTPKGWPFGEQFPRTSGTGRLAGGATFWSDFLYDDHGATGIQVGEPITALAPSDGTYVYSNPKAANNGADIFGAAIGLGEDATYWRVDWNTLEDKTVPIAEWTMDLDRNTATGGGPWPAGAGVRSDGFDRALVVSSRGARLMTAAGKLLAKLPVTVDTAARSFVVRIPDRVLQPSGSWTVRLAAGLANADGTAFAPVGQSDGALPGQPAVYNVTFRTYQQEPEQYRHGIAPNQLGTKGLPRLTDLGNFWMEDHQAEALTEGDVTPFSLAVDWAQLAAERTTPEPRPTGYTNRWYVTTLNLGQGVVHDSGNGAGDLRPNFLGRVQPYAVYVPTTYDPSRPTPLTWILHSLSVQHNQYGALDPQMLQQACEDRHSICATTLGLGPDGWYFDEAEVDFWQVWRELAKAYDLDPDRTVLSGYSMGGFGTYKLGLAYPDLFAKLMPLAGPPMCGVRIAEGAGGAAGAGRCTTDSDTTPLLDSARWDPFVIGQGTLDELVPVSSVLQQVQAIDTLGYRYYFELYPAEDHLVWATQDAFDSEIAQLGDPRRTTNPPRITYTWYPHLTRADLGIGPTGVYWIRDLGARDSAPGTLAHLDAVAARPQPTITPVRTQNARIPGEATPSVVQQLTWQLGQPTPAKAATLTLTNVARLAVDAVSAGLSDGGRLTVTTDGATRLTLTRLAPGTQLIVAGHRVATADRNGSAVLDVTKGATTITVIPPHGTR
jgi:hypothetical protein